MTIFMLWTFGVLEEWEGGRQAKVGEKVRPWLQHMGALRPDLSIAAMIKIKMRSAETEVQGVFDPNKTRRTRPGEVNIKPNE